MKQRWLLGAKELDCSAPRLMQIVNATPDSFFAGSRLTNATASVADQLQALLDAGLDIIDVGGQSTRPGSERVGASEELRRVIPLIQTLRELDGAVRLTIDTYYSAVAKEALAAGADGVNDISAGSIDPLLLDVVADSDCGYVLMHMQGAPETMQQDPHYDDCVAEVGMFLESKLAELELRGINRERVVLDPGIGFGKRLEDNLALIREAGRLAEIGRPLLYGVSRKSFIGKLAGEPDAAGRLPGTLVLTWELLNQGALLHRVHDTRETRQIVDVWHALRNNPASGGN